VKAETDEISVHEAGKSPWAKLAKDLQSPSRLQESDMRKPSPDIGYRSEHVNWDVKSLAFPSSIFFFQ
jgi:hypothetical protein